MYIISTDFAQKCAVAEVENFYKVDISRENIYLLRLEG